MQGLSTKQGSLTTDSQEARDREEGDWMLLVGVYVLSSSAPSPFPGHPPSIYLWTP